MKQLNIVIANDGANALIRGGSATYYGSVFYGLSYFTTYPYFKTLGNKYLYQSDVGEPSIKSPKSLLYFMSGFVSEYLALVLYFPFETVKVRL